MNVNNSFDLSICDFSFLSPPNSGVLNDFINSKPSISLNTIEENGCFLNPVIEDTVNYLTSLREDASTDSNLTNQETPTYVPSVKQENKIRDSGVRMFLHQNTELDVPLPTFSASKTDDVDSFLKSLHHYLTIKNIPAKLQIDFIAGTLIGPAAKWFQYIRHKFNNFERFALCFRGQFLQKGAIGPIIKGRKLDEEFNPQHMKARIEKIALALFQINQLSNEISSYFELDRITKELNREFRMYDYVQDTQASTRPLNFPTSSFNTIQTNKSNKKFCKVKKKSCSQ